MTNDIGAMRAETRFELACERGRMSVGRFVAGRQHARDDVRAFDVFGRWPCGRHEEHVRTLASPGEQIPHAGHANIR